jgi:membrane-bound lytic murein transglycosylase MltF
MSRANAAYPPGVKYMRGMVDRYFANEPMDDINRLLFVFAAYNAGPGRLRQLRREAAGILIRRKPSRARLRIHFRRRRAVL